MTAVPEIGFRPLERRDLADLTTWLAEPGVSAWWGPPPTAEAVAEEYGECLEPGATTQLFVVEVEGRPAGMIQRYRSADEPAWEHTLAAAVPRLAGVPTAGVDYLLGLPELRNRGIGTAMLRSFTDRLLADWPDVVAVITTVQQANRPSWRALEGAGYTRIWAGQLDSDDPSDAGPAYILERRS